MEGILDGRGRVRDSFASRVNPAEVEVEEASGEKKNKELQEGRAAVGDCAVARWVGDTNHDS
jgi:hypothetical protein